MAEPFKNQINAALVERMAAHFVRAWPEFPVAAFRRAALEGLDGLELKQRVTQLARALEAALPEDFDKAAAILEATLAPAPKGDELTWSGEGGGDAGLAGWAVWPMTEYVAARGLGSRERALACLRELTQRASSEFAVRPFLAADPEGTLVVFKKWIHDPSAHVRRLASEGSRPRLPWGMRLQAFVKDPRPCVPLLDALHADSSEYVRRSVANHLNDISKDHPDLAVEIAARWLREGRATTERLVRHALRSLVKEGHGPTLALLGYTGGGKVEAERFRVAPKRVALGGSLALEFVLRNGGSKAAKLVVDYAVHHVKADGSLRPKVFKGLKRTLAAGESAECRIAHPLKRVTTRRYHAGRHAVELLVNGRALARGEFTLALD